MASYGIVEVVEFDDMLTTRIFEPFTRLPLDSLDRFTAELRQQGIKTDVDRWSSRTTATVRDSAQWQTAQHSVIAAMRSYLGLDELRPMHYQAHFRHRDTPRLWQHLVTA